MAHPPEPCPQCGKLMGHEIALLVGQHLTCPPITPDHERRIAAVSALLDLRHGSPHDGPPVPSDRIDGFVAVLDELP